MSLERSRLEELAEYLRGSCNSLSSAMESLGIEDAHDEGQLQIELLDVEIGICVNCYWWHEVHELQFSEDNGGGVCEQCCDDLGMEFD